MILDRRWERYTTALIAVWVVVGWCATCCADPNQTIISGARSDPAPDAAETVTPPPAAPVPSIRDPGPDFADFPNSADVVQPGVYYLEIAPTSQWSSQPENIASGLEVLFRVGVVRDFELRLLGSPLSVIDSDQPEQNVVGAGPFGIGFKYHVYDGTRQWFHPAMGIEFQVALPVATSSELNPGMVLPSGSLNVDHSLPANFSFHWNLGVQTALDGGNDPFWQINFQWSLANDVTPDVQLYVNGISTYPANPSDNGGKNILGFRLPSNGGWSHFIGAGFMWTFSEHAATYCLFAPEFDSGLDHLGGTAQIGVSYAF
jgi:hypothetical protein